FLRRLFPMFHKVRLYRFLFPAVGFIIALLAFLTVALSPDRKAAFVATSRGLDFLRTAVVGFFAALTLVMGRRFSGFDFWIAGGFGVQAAVTLANAATRILLPQTAAVFDTVELITYDLVCFIWIIVFWKGENRPELRLDEQPDPALLQEARTWETMLKE